MTDGFKWKDYSHLYAGKKERILTTIFGICFYVALIYAIWWVFQ